MFFTVKKRAVAGGSASAFAASIGGASSVLTRGRRPPP
jgi:hypothetical protein